MRRLLQPVPAHAPLPWVTAWLRGPVRLYAAQEGKEDLCSACISTCSLGAIFTGGRLGMDGTASPSHWARVCCVRCWRCCTLCGHVSLPHTDSSAEKRPAGVADCLPSSLSHGGRSLDGSSEAVHEMIDGDHQAPTRCCLKHRLGGDVHTPVRTVGYAAEVRRDCIGKRVFASGIVVSCLAPRVGRGLRNRCGSMHVPTLNMYPSSVYWIVEGHSCCAYTRTGLQLVFEGERSPLAVASACVCNPDCGSCGPACP